MRARAAVVAAALLCGGCVGLQDLPVGRSPDGPVYHLTLRFADAGTLTAGGKVKLGQAEVGRVGELRAEGFEAVLTVAVREEVVLPEGTTARIEADSALGEQFVALHPPAGPGPGRLADGAVIRDTSTGPSVEDLLAAAGTVVGGSGLDQVRTIVTETSAAIGGREDKLRELFTRLDTLLGSVQAHRGELTRTVDSLNALAALAVREQATLTAGLTRLAPALRVLADQRTHVQDLLGRVTTLSRVTTEALGRTREQLLGMLPRARQVLAEVGSLDGELGRTLAMLEPFGRDLARAIPGDYLNVDGTLDVPGTILPLLTGSPLPAGSAPEPGGLDALLRGGVR
ncbi:MCE family protein [Amycolatopsis suaedae]|uniref:MCE family protein n=1 Tax=Amycolatopsis suaedae TaxID=2510978 RepID=UPI0013EF1378|nr:MCE family protein [Amycolatopsis suaedae]